MKKTSQETLTDFIKQWDSESIMPRKIVFRRFWSKFWCREDNFPATRKVFLLPSHYSMSSRKQRSSFPPLDSFYTFVPEKGY